MRTGSRRHYVEIQRDMADGQDDIGGWEENFQTQFKRWVEMNPGRGKEYESAKAEHADLTEVLKARYEQRIDALWREGRMRITYDGRTFDVLSCVNKDERSAEMLIYCRERIR